MWVIEQLLRSLEQVERAAFITHMRDVFLSVTDASDSRVSHILGVFF